MSKRTTLIGAAVALALLKQAAPVQAQSTQSTTGSGNQIEEVVVTGIRASLRESLETKREAVGVVDALTAEDVGKFPDKNLAEALQRVPGIVVNCAGSFLLRPLAETATADFDAQIRVNLRGAFLLAREILPAMAAAGGLYVSIGSVADHAGFPENAAYAAAKYGLRGLHETLLAE